MIKDEFKARIDKSMLPCITYSGRDVGKQFFTAMISDPTYLQLRNSSGMDIILTNHPDPKAELDKALGNAINVRRKGNKLSWGCPISGDERSAVIVNPDSISATSLKGLTVRICYVLPHTPFRYPEETWEVIAPSIMDNPRITFHYKK